MQLTRLNASTVVQRSLSQPHSVKEKKDWFVNFLEKQQKDERETGSPTREIVISTSYQTILAYIINNTEHICSNRSMYKLIRIGWEKKRRKKKLKVFSPNSPKGCKEKELDNKTNRSTTLNCKKCLVFNALD